jgi:hypothetical protein
MKELEKIIYELEASLLSQEVRTSVESLDILIADEFIEYGSSGLIYDKKNILERLPKGPSPTYNLYDFQCINLSENIIQSQFKTDKINLDSTKKTSLRTSLWRKSGNNWQIFFHQGTPINN